MTLVPADTIRFPITFDPWYRWLSSALGLLPSKSYVQIHGEQVEVRMGWAFRARFTRSDISSAEALDIRPLSRGVHWLGGIWLVNGAGRGILRIQLNPAQRAHTVGLPIRFREVLVSVSDAPRVAAALAGSPSAASRSMPPNNELQRTRPAQAMEPRR
jgi:hypothetical protein